VAKTGRPRTDRSAQIVVKVRQETRDALESYANEYGYTVAGLVRLLIDEFVGQRQPEGLIGETKHETSRRIAEIFFARFLMLANAAEAVRKQVDSLDYEEMQQRRNDTSNWVRELGIEPVPDPLKFKSKKDKN
jgi:hypothetical protein